jgi:hypothetical protein
MYACIALHFIWKKDNLHHRIKFLKMKYASLFCLMMIMLSAKCQNSTSIYSLGNLAKTDADSFTYAVIGDYGDDSHGEQLVADMVLGWKPLFIITTGDNDYEDKNGKSIDTNISKYYASYINPDLKRNRFFPCLGNHDQSVTERLKVIDEYFRLFPFLHQAENYDFSYGPIHFYSINSGPGIVKATINTGVLTDLKTKSNAATEPFHLAFFHHPQYSSAYGTVALDDHLAGYKLDAVLNGHIHYYERMTDTIRHIEYITIGCSGRNNDKCGSKLDNSKDIHLETCLDRQNGAVKVTVVKIKSSNQWRMTFDYYNVASPKKPSDSFVIIK